MKADPALKDKLGKFLQKEFAPKFSISVATMDGSCQTLHQLSYSSTVAELKTRLGHAATLSKLLLQDSILKDHESLYSCGVTPGVTLTLIVCQEDVHHGMIRLAHEAIRYLHSKRVMHRDISLENVLVSSFWSTVDM
jgi:serine/threonine protein kinase